MEVPLDHGNLDQLSLVESHLKRQPIGNRDLLGFPDRVAACEECSEGLRLARPDPSQASFRNFVPIGR